LNLLQASNIGDGAGYQRALQRSLTAAADRSLDSEQRADAIAFLALVRPVDHLELLKRLVDVQEPAPVQMAAASALGKIPGEAVGTFLISKWRVLTGPVRSQAAEAVLQDPARFPQILRALQQEDIRLDIKLSRSGGSNESRCQIRETARAILDEKPRAGCSREALPGCVERKRRQCAR
jgi:hypothetical protein